ncbi:MAG: hypothetical protein ACM30I_00845 [Gemmatimonas sp.]
MKRRISTLALALAVLAPLVAAGCTPGPRACPYAGAYDNDECPASSANDQTDFRKDH